MEAKKTYNIRLFYDFLNSHGAWERFKELRRLNSDGLNFDFPLEINQPKWWIQDAFEWDKSFDWDDLEEDWFKILKENC